MMDVVNLAVSVLVNQTWLRQTEHSQLICAAAFLLHSQCNFLQTAHNTQTEVTVQHKPGTILSVDDSDFF